MMPGRKVTSIASLKSPNSEEQMCAQLRLVTMCRSYNKIGKQLKNINLEYDRMGCGAEYSTERRRMVRAQEIP